MEFICGFIFGLFSSQFLRQLPSLLHVCCAAAFTIIFCFALKKFYWHRFMYFVMAFSLGFAWMIIYAWYFLSWNLDAKLESKNIEVEGYIASIPIQQNQYIRFDMMLRNLDHKKSKILIRLNWNGEYPKLSVGDKWHLLVKLKRPHGLLNPGGFDKEKQFLVNHIRAEGRVVTSDANICLESRAYRYPLQRVRQYLQHKITRLLPNSPYLGIILALTIGITNDISQEQWQMFRNTGTNHLVAISGLHIGLVASMFGLLIKYSWQRFPAAVLWIAAPRIGLWSGLMMALMYSALAGFSLSTQRSMIMLLLWSLAQLHQRHVSFAWIFFSSMAMVVFINPFAVFSISFWLSYTAVACLLYGMSARLKPSGWWWKWGRSQWIVFIGMLPLSLFFFQQLSFLSIVANIIAIPWVSFLIVPELLIALAMSLCHERLGQLILYVIEKLLSLFWQFLQLLGQHQELIWYHDIQDIAAFLFVTLGIFILLLPIGISVRWIAIIWLAPLFFYTPKSPVSQQIYVTVLDVGQGLATVIRTKNHTLVYDTGLKINESYDMGKIVILPYLIHQHIKSVDMLIISHGDNDHIGGAFSLIKQMPVQQIVTSVPERFKTDPVQFCTAGMHWQWDGVDFKFLHPEKGIGKTKANNMSCVLKLSLGQNSVLLMGDIEKTVEHELVKHYARDLKTSVLVVPHHGSKTSSSAEFLNLARPKYALFSFGYLNRYHHPHKIVWDRYIRYDSLPLDTVSSGAITMTLDKDSDIVLVDRYRISHHRFWHSK